MTERQTILTWLNDVLQQTGETPSGLARRARLATTTLTRFVADPDNAPLPRPSTLLAIARATGIAPPPGLAAPAPQRGGLAEPAPSALDGAPDWVARAIDTLIDGRDERSRWRLTTSEIDAAGYPEGAIVIVDHARQPAAGDVVCAQHYDWHGGAETVFRVFAPPYLLTQTHDARVPPERRRPLVVDNERVAIRGVVIAALIFPS